MANADQAATKQETVMDVTEEQVARVYARAFLGAIAGAANVDGLVAELTSVVDDVLDRFPKLEQTLNSSLVSQEQKEQLLDRIFGGKASSQVLNFLKVLSRHGRLNLVRQAERVTRKLHMAHRGMTEVEIRVAVPIDDALLAEIQNQLRKTLATEPVLSVKVDPSLVAGIVIRVGDRVYDGSVHTRLERARAKMIEQATEQIETRPERFMVA